MRSLPWSTTAEPRRARTAAALVPAALILAALAESRTYREGALGTTLADAVVGVLFIGGGAVVWAYGGERRIAALLALVGVTWFAGNFHDAALYLHRGPLVHVLLSYPTGRLSGRFAAVVVAAAYLDGALTDVAENAWVTFALGGLVAAAALLHAVRARGPVRQARFVALVAALAVMVVLAFGSVASLAGWDAQDVTLWAYQAVLAATAVVLPADLLRRRWSDAVVTRLVVDLGERADAGTLRDRLASALGDPTLEVGYWLAEAGGFHDDAGRPIALHGADEGRAMTRIDGDDGPVALLVHERSLLDDPRLIDAVASAARIAVENARLQREIRSRVEQLEASRRRIVLAADRERARLGRELHEGAEARLARLADRLDAWAPPLDDVGRALAIARAQLRELAQGLHPAALGDGGLPRALDELAAGAAVPVSVSAPPIRLPSPVEVALYFTCSEALANAAKHADATSVRVVLTVEPSRALLRIADDGAGGADASGSGLRGLADRLDALGGRLRVESRPGAGTTVEASVPLQPESG